MNWPEAGTVGIAGFAAALDVAETAWDVREFTLAPNGEDEGGGLGGCPCFSIRLDGFEADGSCWRVGCKPGGGCCVHVRGDAALGNRLKHLLDAMNWYGEWHLEFGNHCRSAE